MPRGEVLRILFFANMRESYPMVTNTLRCSFRRASLGSTRFPKPLVSTFLQIFSRLLEKAKTHNAVPFSVINEASTRIVTPRDASYEVETRRQPWAKSGGAHALRVPVSAETVTWNTFVEPSAQKRRRPEQRWRGLSGGVRHSRSILESNGRSWNRLGGHGERRKPNGGRNWSVSWRPSTRRKRDGGARWKEGWRP
jgi:hypothetical protein